MSRANEQAWPGGRPKKEPGERRQIVAGIRMTVAEREDARAAAKRAGLSLSDFLRRRALRLPVVAVNDDGRQDQGASKKEVARLIHELNSIGVNLNQITRNVNAERLGAAGTRLSDLDELRTKLDRALDRVLEASL